MVRAQRFPRRVAYHEAGHAVARIYVGMPPTMTEICTTGAGISHGTGRIFATPGGGQYAIWDHLIVILAGPYAEARACRRNVVSVLLGGGLADYMAAKELVDWLVAPRGLHGSYAGSRADALDRAEGETLSFLRDNWTAISMVARVLLEKGFISARQLCETAQPRSMYALRRS